MSIFDSPEPRYRLVATNYGDTLRSIAYREMGDAQRWTELVWLNSLQPPYLTNDEGLAGPSVLLFGDKIKVPASAGLNSEDIDDELAFAKDAALVGKLLQVNEAGDLLVVAGVDNLKQQLTHRINTPRGQLVHHPAYGSFVWRLLGTVNGPVAGLLGSEYVRSALLADYRVSSVKRSVAAVSGDSVSIEAVAIAIDGSEVALNQPT